MSTQNEIKLLAEYAKHGNGLNIGCGNVQIGESIGIDMHEGAKAAFLLADARSLPFFKDNQFDYIVSASTLEHINAGPITVLREWLRIIKPGGIIAVLVPDADWTSEDHEGLWCMTGDCGTPGRMGKQRREMEHLHAFTARTLDVLFRFAGMNVIRNMQIDRRPTRPERTLLCVGVKSETYA